MLRILGQRQDGYHLLQTYFQLLNWGDEMQFKLTANNGINVGGEFGNLQQVNNLIYKAAQLLLPHKKTNQGINIFVDKNIPQGSGLGGGSSNAGTTLRTLNQLWQCNLSQQQLLDYALILGADVPVFVLNKSAMAKGIGEQLTPYNLDNYYFVLIFPDTSITTTDVFVKKELVRNQKVIELSQVKDKSYWANICLPVVLNNFPEVKNIYTIASKLATVYMSGTGSTLFSCFDNKIQAEQFISNCPKQWKVKIAQSKIN